MTPQYEDKGQFITNDRRPDYNIDPIFLNRWSPRAFDPDPIDEDTVRSIFEAARWTMSCFNDQPWVIGYAAEKDDLDLYRGLLAEGNQKWAATAPVIGFIFARLRFKHNDKPNRWAEFDCGAAWMALTMQARKFGLYTHGMAGFDEPRVYETLGIPKSDYKAVCAFTLGKYGDFDALPKELKEREKPSDRTPQKEFVFKGTFK
jgi:nitroreductase